jgi:tripartite-type tricarboxylate transporter receptor subunit TctC
MKAIKVAAIIALLPLFVSVGYAQEYPARPIRLIVPTAAGLSTDVLGRIYAVEMEKILHQPVVIDNRPGAGGDIGTLEAVKSTPDGYTLLFGSSSVFAGNKWLYPRSFDQDHDLVPIVHFSDTALILLRGPQFAGKTVAEVMALAKASPKPFAVGSAATINSVAYGLLREATGIDFLLVPYRSNQQAIVDLYKGDTQLMIEALTSGKAMVMDGRLGGLAVTSPKRTDALPNVPTFKEGGLNVVLVGWNLVAGPRGIPHNVVQIINSASNEIVKNPEVRQKMVALSTDLIGGTPEEAAQLIQEDSRNWGRMIKKFDLK